MSNQQPVNGTGPVVPVGHVVPVGPVVPAVPSEREMVDEIDRDRRHERYLVRAALVAALVIGLALTVREIWG